jgi:hypothetical protein
MDNDHVAWLATHVDDHCSSFGEDGGQKLFYEGKGTYIKSWYNTSPNYT